MQAPHWLVSQPTWVPVSPRFSRTNSTSSVFGCTSPDTGLPLTVVVSLTVILSRIPEKVPESRHVTSKYITTIVAITSMPMASGEASFFFAAGGAGTAGATSAAGAGCDWSCDCDWDCD